MRLGVPVEALGVLVDGELPAHAGEWLLAIDGVVNRVANEQMGPRH